MHFDGNWDRFLACGCVADVGLVFSTFDSFGLARLVVV